MSKHTDGTKGTQGNGAHADNSSGHTDNEKGWTELDVNAAWREWQAWMLLAFNGGYAEGCQALVEASNEAQAASARLTELARLEGRARDADFLPRWEQALAVGRAAAQRCAFVLDALLPHDPYEPHTGQAGLEAQVAYAVAFVPNKPATDQPDGHHQPDPHTTPDHQKGGARHDDA